MYDQRSRSPLRLESFNTALVILQADCQADHPEEDVAAALFGEARARGSEDDITIIIARISFSD